MFDLFREIFQALSNNKTRTTLTGLAVAWGIFMLIVLLGMSRGVTNGFQSRMTADNSRVISVFGGFTSKPYKGYKEGRRISPEDEDIKVIERDNRSNVERVTATKSLDSAKLSTSKDYVSDEVQGDFPNRLKEGESLW